MASLTRTATQWTQLQQMGIPGISSVHNLTETVRYWTIVSIKQMYPGHVQQVASAVAGSAQGHFGVKGIIIVDDDIRADDVPAVLWALGSRYDVERGTQIIKRQRATPLDPAISLESRALGAEAAAFNSKIIIDATVPYEWKEKPRDIRLDEKMTEKVLERWNEYGL